jgi:hypothetical protein
MNPAIAIEAVEKLGKNESLKLKIQINSFFPFVGDYFKAKEQQ